jgi:hypothetical protein
MYRTPSAAASTPSSYAARRRADSVWSTWRVTSKALRYFVSDPVFSPTCMAAARPSGVLAGSTVPSDRAMSRMVDRRSEPSRCTWRSVLGRVRMASRESADMAGGHESRVMRGTTGRGGWWRVLGALGVLSGACSGTGATSGVDAGTTTDTGPMIPPGPPRVCRAGTAWSGDAPAFQGGADTATAWGLGDVVGKRLATADLDNDGYPDLVVWDDRPNTRTDFARPPAEYVVRVLMNRPREGAPGRRFVEATRTSNLLALRDGTTAQGRVVSVRGLRRRRQRRRPRRVHRHPSQPHARDGAARDPGDRGTILLNDGRGTFALGPESEITPTPDSNPQTVGAVFALDHDADGASTSSSPTTARPSACPSGSSRSSSAATARGCSPRSPTSVGSSGLQRDLLSVEQQPPALRHLGLRREQRRPPRPPRRRVRAAVQPALDERRGDNFRDESVD